ncbi:flavodoxin-dependent (E)-4-hydroxy-3-methylbut-2-enyl-diphosphate synthase [Patescibacteria group bacterium]|nr:flavodoxin-dependent (E)-4-hydroxy-3-methylbut-2-enyl-diphosphate synthase [Patescibacteria group bacterium]
MKSPHTKIGQLTLGGSSPIRIQSMTNTETADAKITAAQCMELADAGSELVRFTVDTDEAAQAVPEIREILNKNGYEDLPIIGDFHFNGHRLLTQYPECAASLDKYRINPGNVGYGRAHDENFDSFIRVAIANKKAVRIGGNWGSIDRELLNREIEKNAKLARPKPDRQLIIETLVKSTINSAKRAEKLGLPHKNIVLSVKMSEVQDMIAAYELLAKKTAHHPYILHLGLTEAGSGAKGLIASTAALAPLLQKGLGSTIRISITPAPGAPRTAEVQACRILLQEMGFRSYGPSVTSCPGCGRTANDLYQSLAQKVDKYLATNHPQAPIKVAVMGCVVNGPGEASHADIAIALPGKREKDLAQVFVKGKFHRTIAAPNIDAQFLELLGKLISEDFS